MNISSVNRGDCIVQYRQSRFGNAVFSIRATIFWNSLSKELRECNSLFSFKKQHRCWFGDTYTCKHTSYTWV